MLIANPIYDVVFKYLMANLDIAKGVISTIIDEDIATLDFKAQENVLKFTKGDTKELTYYHLDFVAKIKLKEGGYKNVLIELQKTNVPYDIERFRKYLTDDLLIKILRQLEKAAGDEELQRQLELEEMALSEYESTFAEFERRIEEKHKKLEQSARELEQKDKYIKELLEKLEKPGIG
jgi:hypothetical protein